MAKASFAQICALPCAWGGRTRAPYVVPAAQMSECSREKVCLCRLTDLAEDTEPLGYYSCGPWSLSAFPLYFSMQTASLAATGCHLTACLPVWNCWRSSHFPTSPLLFPPLLQAATHLLLPQTFSRWFRLDLVSFPSIQPHCPHPRLLYVIFLFGFLLEWFYITFQMTFLLQYLHGPV